jgi:ferrous iron transport protein A
MNRLLSDIKPDQWVRVERVLGGRYLSRRLMGMGISCGTRLQVLYVRVHGMVIAANSNRIALDYGIARQLEVSELAHDSGAGA